MVLNISLLKSTSMFCAESIAATVATWLGRRYEMMFSNMWGFRFDKEKAIHSKFIGINLYKDYQDDEVYKNLEKYHGIRIVTRESDADNLIANIIINELNNRMPIVVFVNTRNCPWLDEEYDSLEQLLVIGYDDCNFTCLDVHNNLKFPQQIPISNVVSAYNRVGEMKAYITFEVVLDEQRNIGVDELILHIKESESLTRNPFQEMRQLADCIEFNFGYDMERGNESNPFNIPILLNIMEICRARRLVSDTFLYISQLNNNKLMENLSMGFSELGGEWNTVWNLLLKVFYFGDSKSIHDIIPRISSKIREVADNEENIIHKIIHDCFDESGKMFIASERKHEILQYQNSVSVDISGYLNNRAFAESELNVNGADMTGHHEFFLPFGIPKNGILDILDIPFRIYNQANGNDNISCMCQELDADLIVCNRIMFLGCSEWGNGYDYIELLYDDGSVEKLLIDFPDWYYNGVSDVPVAWYGDIIGFNENKEKRSLFLLSFALNHTKSIKKMIFPDNPNIHIFSISYETAVCLNT